MDALAGTRVLTTPAARSVIETFDPATLLTQTVTTPDLAPVSLTHDARGLIVSRAFGTRTASRAHAAAGNVAAVTDPRGTRSGANSFHAPPGHLPRVVDTPSTPRLDTSATPRYATRTRRMPP